MNSWDERYSASEYVYGTEPNGFLVQVADRLRPGDLLSLAEGEGRNAVYLAGLGHRVSAVDSSAVGLAKARELAARKGVMLETTCGDLAEYDPGQDRWDSVVSIFCHLPGAVRADLYRRVCSGLRSGGLLVIEAYTPAQLAHGTGGPRDVSLLVSLETLRTELEGLEFLIARETERTVVEGTLHTGLASVVQVLARKP